MSQAELSFAYWLSSAAPCGSVRCGTVPFGALLCRAACCVALTLSSMPGITGSITPGTGALGLYVLHFQITKKALPAQLSSVRAQQHSAVRCRAVPCPALRCSALPCFPMIFFVRTVPDIMRSTRWYHAPVCTCVFVYLLSWLTVVSRSSSYPSPPTQNYTRTDRFRSKRDIASKHTAQRRGISSAHVALDKIS